jgi:hypothetical protein
MSYWDVEMRPWYGRLEALSPPERLRVATAAVDTAVDSLEPSYEQAVAEDDRRVIDALRGAARRATDAGRVGLDPEELEALFEEVDGVLEDTQEEVGRNLLMALLALPDEGGLPVEGLAAILDGAYQSVVANAGLPVYGVEPERASDRCRRAVAAQQRLIEAAAS